jgi:RNA polymerase sigma-70 factor (ECF subfamily)
MALAPNDMGGTERGNSIRLVTAHRSGDAAAFSEIVRTHYATLLGCARRRLSNPQDAEDAVQEAFLRAYRRLETFGTEGDWRLGAWLNTILSNVCTDMLIRRRPTAPFDEWADGRADDHPDPVDLVSDTVVHDAIARAIATLPQSQRSAFLMRMVDDRPYEEVAATLGITEDNARARVARARSALQRTLSRSEALTGMLGAAPLLLAGSVRSALRRLFSSNASDSAHATTAATLAGNASTAAAEAAAASGAPVTSGMQFLGQLAASPVAQVALVASTSTGGRGSVVLGVVASLAAAGGLSVPAVAAAGSSQPSAAVQSAPHLTSATTPIAPGAGAGTSGSSAAAPSSTAATSTSSQPPSAPSEPSWVTLAASAAVNNRAVVSSGGSSASSPAPSTAGGGGSGSAPSPTSTGGGGALAVGTCSSVSGFPGVTAPTTIPAIGSSALVAMMTAGAPSVTATPEGPAFQASGTMSDMGTSPVPVSVTAGTCLAEGGSILAVDLTGSTGAEVQLVGSLVSSPVATGSSTAGSVSYLFRGLATQVAGAALPGGRLPWNASSSFVAELQVQAAGTATLDVVFVETRSPTATVTTPASTSPTSPVSTGTSPTPPGRSGTGSTTGTTSTTLASTEPGTPSSSDSATPRTSRSESTPSGTQAGNSPATPSSTAGS